VLARAREVLARAREVLARAREARARAREVLARAREVLARAREVLARAREVQVRDKGLVIQVRAEVTTIQCPALVKEGVDNNGRPSVKGSARSSTLAMRNPPDRHRVYRFRTAVSAASGGREAPLAQPPLRDDFPSHTHGEHSESLRRDTSAIETLASLRERRCPLPAQDPSARSCSSCASSVCP
jgi:hypothetical protein